MIPNDAIPATLAPAQVRALVRYFSGGPVAVYTFPHTDTGTVYGCYVNDDDRYRSGVTAFYLREDGSARIARASGPPAELPPVPVTTSEED
jgi:hypothetical protein